MEKCTEAAMNVSNQVFVYIFFQLHLVLLLMSFHRVYDNKMTSAFINKAYVCFCLQDPKTYVSALLEVHLKYSAMVTLSFADDAGFIQALDKVDC